MKKYLTGAAAVLLLLIGFWIGRATLPVKERVEYVPLPAVRGSLTGFELTPISEVLAGIPRFIPIYRDLSVPQQARDSAPAPPEHLPARQIDTLASYRATIEDWNIRRTYARTLFDDPQLGRLSLTAAIQYNKLDTLGWEFAPIQRTVTQIRRPTWQPFASIGYNTFEQGSIGVGALYKNVGGQVRLIRDFRGQRTALGGEVMIRF